MYHVDISDAQEQIRQEEEKETEEQKIEDKSY